MAGKSDWAGRVGLEWARKARQMNAFLAPLGEIGLQALGDVSGAQVLDVGCGAGQTSRALTARGGKVTGVDVSPDLIAAARAEGGAIDYRLGDAGADDLGGPHDALFSRFGAMFFDDPPVGWGHVRGHMTPGAKGVIVAWRGIAHNPWAALPAKWMTPVLGKDRMAPAPDGAPGPFAWGDEAYVRGVLQGAGWRDVALDARSGDSVISLGDDPDPVARACKSAMQISPVAGRLKGATEAEVAAVRAALYDGFSDHVVNGQVRLGTSVWIISMVA